MNTIKTWAYCLILAAILAVIGYGYSLYSTTKTQALQLTAADGALKSKDTEIKLKNAALKTAHERIDLQFKHAKTQQEKVAEYEESLKQIARGRSADAGVIDGLRKQVASFKSAGVGAGGGAGATYAPAASREPDQYRAIESALVEAAGLLADGAELLAESGGLIAQRDAEVTLMQGLVGNDRALSQGAVK